MDRHNIIFIVLDTCRKDALSCYDGFCETPHLDALAEEGVKKDDVYATACWTLPSHASMFTGRMPHAIGVESTDDDIKGESTFVEDLQEWGYTTIGLSNMPLISERYGFDAGFDIFRYVPNVSFPSNDFYYDFREKNIRDEFDSFREKVQYILKNGDLKGVGNISRFKIEKWISGYFGMFDKGAAATNRLVDRYLTETSGKRFLFLNYREAHSPYIQSWRYMAKYGIKTAVRTATTHPIDYFVNDTNPEHPELVQQMYRNDVEYLDKRIGELFDILKNHEILDNCKIIITSDHGENLGENGKWGHTNDLSDILVNVPFISLGFNSDEVTSLRQIPNLVQGKTVQQQPAFSEFHGGSALDGKHTKSRGPSFWNRILQSVRTDKGRLIRGSDGLEEKSGNIDSTTLNRLLDQRLEPIETSKLDI